MMSCGTSGRPFDVFLSFSGSDRDVVDGLGETLRAAEFQTSLEVLGNQESAKDIRVAISQVPAAVICIGAKGIDAAQQHEVDAIVGRDEDPRFEAMVLILPSCGPSFEPPDSLTKYRVFDLRLERSVTMDRLLRRLKWDQAASAFLETQASEMGPEISGAESIGEFMVDLRTMARRLLVSGKDEVSVRATDLVMSALARSRRSEFDPSELTWANRDQFFAVMYREMRRSITDHARRRLESRLEAEMAPAVSDSEDIMEFDLYDLPGLADERPDVIIALEEAVVWLEEEDRVLADYAKHHYFLGMTVSEMASFFDLSEKEVKRSLARARLLLHERIEQILRHES